MNEGGKGSRDSFRPRLSSGREHDPFSLADREPLREAEIPRLFIREPGWHVHLKSGSDRMFCFLIAPGEDHYHRIGDGEIYLQRGDERICLPCADRHGLLQHEPKALRPSVRGFDLRAGAGARDDTGGDYGLRDEGSSLGD
jgi:hypothetical protein